MKKDKGSQPLRPHLVSTKALYTKVSTYVVCAFAQNKQLLSFPIRPRILRYAAKLSLANTMAIVLMVRVAHIRSQYSVKGARCPSGPRPA